MWRWGANQNIVLEVNYVWGDGRQRLTEFHRSWSPTSTSCCVQRGANRVVAPCMHWFLYGSEHPFETFFIERQQGVGGRRNPVKGFQMSWPRASSWLCTPLVLTSYATYVKGVERELYIISIQTHRRLRSGNRTLLYVYIDPPYVWSLLRGRLLNELNACTACLTIFKY